MTICLKIDDCGHPDWKPLWGNPLDPPSMASVNRVEFHESGGFMNGPYRTTRALKGEERTELGYNSRNPAMTTFQRFYEGERKNVGLIFKLDKTFPLASPIFQVITQIKQAGPYGNEPVLSLRAMRDEVHLINGDYRKPLQSGHAQQEIIWREPIKVDVWTCISLDAIWRFNGGELSVNGAPALTNLCLLHPQTCSHQRTGIYGNGGVERVVHWDTMRVDG